MRALAGCRPLVSRAVAGASSRPASALPRAALRSAVVSAAPEHALMVETDPFKADVAAKVAKGGASIARSKLLSTECEDAVNTQLNVELTISHIYLSMAVYFDRDDVSLPGLAKFFLDNSNDEKRHAQELMTFMNRRGGRVLLGAIPEPASEFGDGENGDALAAMELALSLEQLNYTKLNALDSVANKMEDFNLSDLVDEMLKEQAKDVKEMANYVRQLTRVGKGHGTWAWDRDLRRRLYDEGDEADAAADVATAND